MGTTPIEVRDAVVTLRTREHRQYAEIAELLGIGVATVNRILRRHREDGCVEPKPRGGGWVSLIHDGVADLLLDIVAEMPDATVAELTAVLEQRASIRVSRSSVLRALHRLGYSKKRPRSAPRSETRPSTMCGDGRTAR